MGFVTFGEILLRLTPSERGCKIGSSNYMEMNFAGSESNVASSLGVLGNSVQFVTKLPDNDLGRAASGSLLSYGVTVDNIRFGGNRIGIYFIEVGSSIRPSKVIYDRKDSAISTISDQEFDWTQILVDKEWLFISGITPALSENCAMETIKVAETAHKLGVKVAFDPNFRRTLWSSSSEARKVYLPILENTDLLLGNYGMLQDVFGYQPKGKDTMEKSLDAIEEAVGLLGVSNIAFTVRDHFSASKNRLSGLLRRDNGEILSGPSYEVAITDRFGTGDSFAAGLLHGFGNQWDAQKSLDFATAAFALKHTIKGDQHTSSEAEITSIMNGNIQGHVLR
jgi:2-dehydro-3-deoxygluconokinase